MEVFVSWSGERSGAAAKALRDWLPMVINALKPWISSDDVDKGTRWSAEIASRLKNVKAGIICLTPSNLHNDWILFEAGAISKSVENTFVCPLLIDLQPNEISGPLTQFQATRITKEDLLKLLKTLNNARGENALERGHVEEAFETWWPKLGSKLAALPAEQVTSRRQRSESEILDELLELTRGLARQQSSLISSLTYIESQAKAQEQQAILEKMMVPTFGVGVASYNLSPVVSRSVPLSQAEKTAPKAMGLTEKSTEPQQTGGNESDAGDHPSDEGNES